MQKDFLHNKNRISNFKLKALLDITNAINSNVKIPKLLETFKEVVVDNLNVGKLALFIHKEKWDCVFKYKVENDFERELNIEKDLLKNTEIQFLSGEKSTIAKYFDVIVPIKHKKRQIAFLLIGDIDNDKIEVSPVIKHLAFIQTLTNIIIVALENKRLFKQNINQAVYKKELELASHMQNLLFPNELPNDDTIIADALYFPHQEVGGDYYDYFELNKNEVLFCLADVSGKGVAAALLMSNFQANLRTLSQYVPKLTDLIKELNAKVISNAKGEKFITLFVAKYNKETRMLNYINAGHNPPFLIGKTSCRMLNVGCVGLGMLDEIETVQEGITHIKQNDLFVGYTDGLVEVKNNDLEFYSPEKIAETIKANYNLSPGILNQTLLWNVIEFKQDQNYTDDVTILSLKFL